MARILKATSLVETEEGMESYSAIVLIVLIDLYHATVRLLSRCNFEFLYNTFK